MTCGFFRYCRRDFIHRNRSLNIIFCEDIRQYRLDLMSIRTLKIEIQGKRNSRWHVDGNDKKEKRKNSERTFIIDRSLFTLVNGERNERHLTNEISLIFIGPTDSDKIWKTEQRTISSRLSSLSLFTGLYHGMIGLIEYHSRSLSLFSNNFDMCLSTSSMTIRQCHGNHRWVVLLCVFALGEEFFPFLSSHCKNIDVMNSLSVIWKH